MHRSRIGLLLSKLHLSAAITMMAKNANDENDERILNADGVRGDPKPKKKTRHTRRYYRERDKNVASRYSSPEAIARAIRRAVRWNQRHGGDPRNAPAHIWEKISLANEVLS